MHGWEGWVGLAKGGTQDRRKKREKAEGTWAKHYKPRSKRSNAHVRGAVADLARVDLADWLASCVVHDSPPGPAAELKRHSENFLPLPGAETAGATTEPREAATESCPESISPPTSGSVSNETETRGESASSPRPSPVEQVELFAKAMTAESLWQEITAELAAAVPNAADTARQLAHHGWCDLFIGLIQVIEKCKTLADQIPEWGKKMVKESILKSSKQGVRPLITQAVVDIVVDKVWAALKGAAVANVPLLSVVTGEDAVRSLRILALFSCPAPEDHDEVRKHALKPLGDDVAGIITTQTKERLAKLFKEWTDEEAA
ncbi:hypothetical protein AB0L13_25455 [Saccharopolyspora shandongensis]|uniref:hypothetical protein n=1 Tax=Saccharopolyspora shandongensis TaxID=418495 RepID=UPI00342842CF